MESIEKCISDLSCVVHNIAGGPPAVAMTIATDPSPSLHLDVTDTDGTSIYEGEFTAATIEKVTASLPKTFDVFCHMLHGALHGTSPSVKFQLCSLQELAQLATADPPQASAAASPSVRSSKFALLHYTVEFTKTFYTLPLQLRKDEGQAGGVPPAKFPPQQIHQLQIMYTNLLADHTKLQTSYNALKHAMEKQLKDCKKLLQSSGEIERLQAENDELRRELRAARKLRTPTPTQAPLRRTPQERSSRSKSPQGGASHPQRSTTPPPRAPSQPARTTPRRSSSPAHGQHPPSVPPQYLSDEGASNTSTTTMSYENRYHRRSGYGSGPATAPRRTHPPLSYRERSVSPSVPKPSSYRRGGYDTHPSEYYDTARRGTSPPPPPHYPPRGSYHYSSPHQDSYFSTLQHQPSHRRSTSPYGGFQPPPFR